MKIQRIVTAEGNTGVATRIDTFDTATIAFLTNIWGFDKVPGLPLTPEQVLGEYRPLGMFGPLGGLRVDLFTLAPETAEDASELQRAASVDMGTPGMVFGIEGDGMHRTNSIDLAIVMDGEVNADYPGEDGEVHDLTLKAGDLMINNGTFHSWHNRSTQACTILFVVLAAERETT